MYVSENEWFLVYLTLLMRFVVDGVDDGWCEGWLIATFYDKEKKMLNCVI